ncbi:hypothetical protein SAMN04488132_10549 [Sediminibacterium ginsengisoli]|uniref:Uncharacterized protein n=2 Tax=Sediminibacterium ginsengisoli TaxID=413434 RepID=A0A1T4NYP2_9BACT|nr:hypothetical protein SAMN04488132_10549 [Sediminibacterium ginsengisoli]
MANTYNLMPRKTKQEILTHFKAEAGQNKIQVIKNGMETSTIISFPQIFAIIAKSNLQSLLGGEFYAFDKKIEDPGRFSLNEVEIFADFFQVKFDVMLNFIRRNQLEAKKKRKKTNK